MKKYLNRSRILQVLGLLLATYASVNASAGTTRHCESRVELKYDILNENLKPQNNDFNKTKVWSWGYKRSGEAGFLALERKAWLRACKQSARDRINDWDFQKVRRIAGSRCNGVKGRIIRILELKTVGGGWDEAKRRDYVRTKFGFFGSQSPLMKLPQVVLDLQQSPIKTKRKYQYYRCNAGMFFPGNHGVIDRLPSNHGR